MKIDVLTFDEEEDGSATVVFNLDAEAIAEFVKIGILKALIDAANDSKEST